MRIKAFKMNGEPVAVEVEELLRAFVRTFEKMDNERSKQSRAINKKHEKLKIAEVQRDRYKAQCEHMDETLDKILNSAEWDGHADVNVIIEALRSDRDLLTRTIRARDERINYLERRIREYENNKD